MKILKEKNEEYAIISSQEDLNELFEKFFQKELFAYKFKFKSREYFLALLSELQINIEEFELNYYYFNYSHNLHISESEFGYVWISTYGLIAMNKPTNNSSVNSFKNQFTVISLLFDKAIELSQSKKIHDIDSYNFGELSVITPAIFSNVIFYIELFCKAYLNLTDNKVPHTHKLKILHQKVIETMIKKNHSDTLFNLLF